MNQEEADEWSSSWTDLSHEDFTQTMHSVNTMFANLGLAVYSLMVLEKVGNLLNPAVSSGLPGEGKQEHHWRLNLQTCNLRELLKVYGSVLSARDIWNMVGPSKVGNGKQFQVGFPVITNRRTNSALRAGRRQDCIDKRLKAVAWTEARGLSKPQCPEDYAIILRQMSFEVHCMNFLHNPSWLEELPDAPVVDSPHTPNAGGV